MDDPRDLALDDEGFMYITNNGRGLIDRPHVAVYSPGWSGGPTPPSSLIYGVNTLLTDPYGIALDDLDRVYVTNQAQNSVTVYQTQRINLDPVDDVPWTTTSVTLSATATSGLAVTITTTSPSVCSGSGSSPVLVTIVAMGTCTFDVSQAGDARQLPAQLSTSFRVTKAPQSITLTTPADVSLSQRWTRVKASTTSGVPVVWTSETPDVCLHKRGFGQRVALKATGTCTLSAYQRGNSLWDSAGPETVSFEVTP